ncbi:hypothetical protein E3N88_39736 [Mikania micrantha]|uniref:DUF4005 domain-containing protein n=1 Tax=Mikania micrantha TaxID=192012 RepID=A0A5N6LKN2_9ASTR|nr:hypothetical protein E3N88_39736 [Mikania micrantha]
MGKKGGWFSSVRKVFNSGNDSKEKKEQKTHKITSKKSWFGKQKNIESESSQPESAFATPALRSPPPYRDDDFKFAESEAEPSEFLEPDDDPSKTSQPEYDPNKPIEPEHDPSKPTKLEIEQKKPTKPENEQSQPVHTISYATATAAAAAAAFRRFLGKSKEEVAAIRVQAAFRRFLAKRKLRALKGVVRLKVLVQSQSVKRQAVATLRCMQTLARVQSQVRARRIRMSEENQALQRQLMQKRERELDKMKSYTGTEWDNTRRSKEQIEASIQNKEEATARRERALAYAQTQQIQDIVPELPPIHPLHIHIFLLGAKVFRTTYNSLRAFFDHTDPSLFTQNFLSITQIPPLSSMPAQSEPSSVSTQNQICNFFFADRLHISDMLLYFSF